MKSHVVESAHPKLAITKELVVVNHNWQFGKKQSRPFECAITSYFGASNPYKKFDEAQQQIFEDLVLYICKGYKPLSTCDNIWLKRLVLCFYSHVVFPSQATFVGKVLHAMIKKTMQLHVLSRLVEATTLLASFDF